MCGLTRIYTTTHYQPDWVVAFWLSYHMIMVLKSQSKLNPILVNERLNAILPPLRTIEKRSKPLKCDMTLNPWKPLFCPLHIITYLYSISYPFLLLRLTAASQHRSLSFAVLAVAVRQWRHIQIIPNNIHTLCHSFDFVIFCLRPLFQHPSQPNHCRMMSLPLKFKTNNTNARILVPVFVTK